MRVQNYSFQMNEPKIYLTNIRFLRYFSLFYSPYSFYFYPKQEHFSFLSFTKGGIIFPIPYYI